MINKAIIQKISNKEMDRKEFLKYSGVVLIGLIGLKGITALISQVDKPSAMMESNQVSRGFGSGKYGA